MISIHAPRMGSDRDLGSERHQKAHFNPRSPDGERPQTLGDFYVKSLFQSTLPGWGATGAVFLMRGLVVISIHAPRMGSDSVTVYVP